VIYLSTEREICHFLVERAQRTKGVTKNDNIWQCDDDIFPVLPFCLPQTWKKNHFLENVFRFLGFLKVLKRFF